MSIYIAKFMFYHFQLRIVATPLEGTKTLKTKNANSRQLICATKFYHKKNNKLIIITNNHSTFYFNYA